MFAVVVVAFALVPRLAAGADCFTESEWRAAHVRVLQTELNVAQLECSNVAGANYDMQYKSFIDKFKDRLKANATLLKAHFRRVFGKGSDTELDKFVTKLANDASDRSMRDMKFCANSASLFQDAMAIDTPQFEQAALDHVTDHSEVGDECPVKPAVIKASVKAPAKASSGSAKAPAQVTAKATTTGPTTKATTAAATTPTAAPGTQAGAVQPAVATAAPTAASVQPAAASSSTPPAPAQGQAQAAPAKAPTQSAEKPAPPKANSDPKASPGTAAAPPNAG